MYLVSLIAYICPCPETSSPPCRVGGNNYRSVLHIFVTATKTLLTHTISNPSNAQAQADLELLEPLLTLMGMLAASGESHKVGEIYQSCVEMFNMARTAVLNASLPDISPNQTRIIGRARGEESMQDFLRRMENIREGYDGDMN